VSVIEDGHHAKQLLNDELLQAAFKEAEQDQINVFLDPSADSDKLDKARAMVFGLELLRRTLNRYVLDGELKAKKDQDRGSD
jgi:hypothetical protein